MWWVGLRPGLVGEIATSPPAARRYNHAPTARGCGPPGHGYYGPVRTRSPEGVAGNAASLAL